MDIAVARGGRGRRDAERHDVAGSRAIRRIPAGHDESLRVADQVIGRDDQHDRVRVLPLPEAGRDRDRGGRVAAHRF